MFIDSSMETEFIERKIYTLKPIWINEDRITHTDFEPSIGRRVQSIIKKTTRKKGMQISSGITKKPTKLQ